jgi:tetratricopeptide (TPR) repeat protein
MKILKHILFFYSFHPFLILLLLSDPSFCFSQNERTDSLILLTQSTNQDTAKVNAYNELFLEYEFSNPEKAKEYVNQAAELAKKIAYNKGLALAYTYSGYLSEDLGNYPEALKNHALALKVRVSAGDKKGIANSYNNLGIIYYNQGSYSDALKNQFISVGIKEKIDDKKGLASSYNCLGNIYSALGNYPEALKNYFAFMKVEEELKNRGGMASAYNNIGIIYKRQGNYSEALKNFTAAINIQKEIGDKRGVARTYNNMGNVHLALNNLEQALNNYFVSLKTDEEMGSKYNIALSNNNIATVYVELAMKESNPSLMESKFNLALKHYQTALQLREMIGDKAGIAETINNIGVALTRQGSHEKATAYIIKANKLLKELGNKELLKESYKALYKLDSIKGNFKESYTNYKLYILYKDSLDNEETRKKTIQNQMTFDFEKKEAVASAEHTKELENQKFLAAEKDRKQKTVLLFVVFGFMLVLIFAGFVFRSLRITRTQKNIIEQQKNLVEQQKRNVEDQKLLVEEKQKEIIDSITYARRIQQSLMPTEMYIGKNLKKLMRR